MLKLSSNAAESLVLAISLSYTKSHVTIAIGGEAHVPPTDTAILSPNSHRPVEYHTRSAVLVAQHLDVVPSLKQL